MTFRELSFFYHNFEIAQNSGVNLIQHLETLVTTSSDLTEKKKILFIIKNIKEGRSLTSALSQTMFVPVFDLPLIDIGEKSGKLTYIFQLLHRNYEVSADAELAIKTSSVRPAFLFICAVFIPSIPDFLVGETSFLFYLIKNFSIVVFIFIGAKFLHHLFLQSYYNKNWANKRHELIKKIPRLQNLAELMALEKFCTCLEISLEVGNTMHEALKMAGNAASDHQFNLAARRIISELKSGKTLPEAISTESIFPSNIQNCIKIGSERGEISQMLHEEGHQIKKDIHSGILNLSVLIPIIIYWASGLFAGLSISILFIKDLFMIYKLF
jgi:type II secretory pathway component PulF